MIVWVGDNGETGRFMGRGQGDGPNRGSMNLNGVTKEWYVPAKSGSRGVGRVVGRGKGDGRNQGR